MRQTQELQTFDGLRTDQAYLREEGYAIEWGTSKMEADEEKAPFVVVIYAPEKHTAATPEATLYFESIRAANKTAYQLCDCSTMEVKLYITRHSLKGKLTMIPADVHFMESDTRKGGIGFDFYDNKEHLDVSYIQFVRDCWEETEMDRPCPTILTEEDIEEWEDVQRDYGNYFSKQTAQTFVPLPKGKMIFDCNLINWDLLKKQKNYLVNEMLAKKGEEQKVLEGIINILDSLQDDAALTIGQDKVFGPYSHLENPYHLEIEQWNEMSDEDGKHFAFPRKDRAVVSYGLDPDNGFAYVAVCYEEIYLDVDPDCIIQYDSLSEAARVAQSLAKLTNEEFLILARS